MVGCVVSTKYLLFLIVEDTYFQSERIYWFPKGHLP